MPMAKSTYYYEIDKVDAVAIKNTELLLEIQSIYIQNKRRYGVRRIHRELCNRGHIVNHKRVQRLMHEAGLIGKRPKEKYHSYKGEVGKIADNVIDRDFSATMPLQKWTTDVSQFNFSWGKCYLSPILDMATNEIISYDLIAKSKYGADKTYVRQSVPAISPSDRIDFSFRSRLAVSTCLLSQTSSRAWHNTIHVSKRKLLR